MKLETALQIKSLNDETGEVVGYGSVFDLKDAGGETVRKGAFTKSLERHKTLGTMPAMLWQHSQKDPIGVWTSVEEDNLGLKVTGRLLVNDDPLAKKAYAHLKAGSVTGLSIGYIPAKYGKNGGDLTELDLKEVSFVTIPMNDAARLVSVKSFDDANSIRDIEDALRDVCDLSQADRKAVVSAMKRVLLRDVESEIAEKQMVERLTAITNSLSHK